MSDLRTELDAVLDTVTPGEAPVEAAMRHGRRLRARRRAAAVTVVAAVAVAVAVPAFSRGHAAAPGPARPAPVTGHRYPAITVQPPGMGSPDDGLIALGTVGSQHWEVNVSAPGTLGQCFTAAIEATSLGSVCDRLTAPGPAPAGWTVSGGGGYQFVADSVAPAVTYVVVTTADRQELKLIPVTRGQARFVGLVLPESLMIDSVTAYLGNGQEVAVGQSGPIGAAAPRGQVSPPISETLIVGTTDGRSWTASATVGPSDTCFSTSEGQGDPVTLSCVPLARVTSLALFGYARPAAGPPTVFYGSAPAAAYLLTVTLTDGHSFQVSTSMIGTENLWAFALGRGQAVRHWAAFDASGRLVATGTVSHFGA